jgi:hypothetical protein
VLALASVAAAAGLLRVVFSGSDRPAIFRRLGLPRTPVIGLLLTLFLLTSVVGSPVERAAATSHGVRTIRLEGAESPAPCANDHGVLNAIEDENLRKSAEADELCRWVDNILDQRAAGTLPQTETLPLVLVTASGGGVRAAAWTTRVLDCLLFAEGQQSSDSCPTSTAPATGADQVPRRDLWPYVFAGGGASGGSVGLASAAAEWIAPVLNADGTPRADWARSIAEPDHLAPVAGQMLTAELGLSLLGIVPEHDRAETLIDDWSVPFGPVTDRCPAFKGEEIEKVGFLRAAAGCSGNVPLLLFNGTIVRTGTRFDISPLDEAGEDGSLGLRDVLCRGPGVAQDIPFFDAAFMSGRFPFVTPSGRIGYERPAGCMLDVPSPVDVVDGGYHENSGTAQIAELWDRLRPVVKAVNKKHVLPEIRPIVLKIENGEVGDSSPLGCLPEVSADEPDPTPAPAKPTTSATPADKQDRSVRFGEPLRVPWTLLANNAAERDEPHAEDGLISTMCPDHIPVVTMALYEHPGRALPLGWSLTDNVLDDLQHVFALDPNRCRAEAFLAYIDGRAASSVSPRPCAPCDSTTDDTTVAKHCALEKP